MVDFNSSNLKTQLNLDNSLIAQSFGDLVQNVLPPAIKNYINESQIKTNVNSVLSGSTTPDFNVVTAANKLRSVYGNDAGKMKIVKTELAEPSKPNSFAHEKAREVARNVLNLLR